MEHGTVEEIGNLLETLLSTNDDTETEHFFFQELYLVNFHLVVNDRTKNFWFGRTEPEPN